MREAEELPFPLEEYRLRLGNVRAKMAGQGLDLLLIHSLPDQYYLTGYQTFDPVGYSCFFLPLEGEPVFEVWKTETENVTLNAWVEEMAPWATGVDPFAVTGQVVKERGDGGHAEDQLEAEPQINKNGPRGQENNDDSHGAELLAGLRTEAAAGFNVELVGEPLVHRRLELGFGFLDVAG